MRIGHIELPVADPGLSRRFYTDSLATWVETLSRRGLALMKCGNCHHFQDPDGHGFQLVNPGDDQSADAG